MLVPGAAAIATLVVFFHLALMTGSSPLSPLGQGLVINEFIRYFEPATYDRGVFLGLQADRHKRDLKTPGIIRLDIIANNRVFRLRLSPDTDIYADDAFIESSDGRSTLGPARAYIGTLEDDERANVRGVVTSDGLFDGTVSTRLDDFYVEPASRYQPPGANTSPRFHTIVYRAADVIPPPTPPCASHALHRDGHVHSRKKRWNPEDEIPASSKYYPKNNTHNYSYPRFPRNNTNLVTNLKTNNYNPTSIYYTPNNNRNNPNGTKILINSPKKGDPREPYDSKQLHPLDSEEMSTTEDPNAKHVHKRATIDPKKTTCMLYLQADHLFYQKYGTEEACIEVMTRHVQRVNTIYRHTDFNQDGKPDNISFMIKRIKVHSTEALKDPTYRFPLNYGVEKFLELFSEEDYDAFCLAYMFTYRDFEMGTLGLAWTGDLKNAGGVCEKNGHYRGSLKSLNTGIVTLLNYGKHVPPAVSHVTLAHEIGHNFGSPHDPENCTPGGEDGNFIMFARATSGDKKNNNKFSPCSLDNINPVLNAKARSLKGCFTEPQAAICGNGVVEAGEECDCGWEEDCRDRCCFPQRRYPPAEEPPCRLTANSVCSPSQGPCCTAECSLKFADKCRDDNGCRDSSFCDGRGPHCPPSINKPNKTICNEEFVCFMGECTGSICLAYGLESCQCIPGPHDVKTKACELCCKLRGDDQPCMSSYDWNSAPYDIPDMYSKPGTPCNEYNGYCDVFQKCREVDPSGPLATLRKLLLSDESIASFKRWVTDHWYAVLLIVIAVLFLLVLSTKLLGKHPNLKLKSITIIHSSTTETVRLPPEGEGGQVTVHPAAIRSKLPLKRKVREARDKHRRKRAKSKELTNNANNANDGNNANKKHVKKKKKILTEDGAKKSEPRSKKIEERKKSPLKTKTKKNKEVIDYSAAQEKDKLAASIDKSKNPFVSSNDPVVKVKNWLLHSQQPERSLIPKSKSTPINLTSGHRSPVKTRTVRPTNHLKSRSTGNIQNANKTSADKVRLQVVYKPPFKFSLKLRKADKPVTSVVVDKNIRSTTEHNSSKPAGKRAAVLVKQREKHWHGSKSQGAAALQLPPVAPALALAVPGAARLDDQDIDSNIHTVPSDLDVLLSESEFLFSSA